MTEQFIIIILLIALGYLLKRINFIKSADSQVLSTLVLNVTLPSLVIVNLNSANLDLSFSILPIMMLIYGILAKVIMVALFRKYDNHVKGSVGMMAASLNIGLFAYPLVETIWPKNGMIYFGMANIHLPKASIDFFTIISKANMPLSMILLGIMLSFRIEKQFLPIAVKYLIVHYGLGCIAGLLVHFFLPTSDDMIKTTLLITWLLPVGVAIIPYSIQFKYKTLPLVGMVTNISIVISIIIIYIYQAIFV